MAVKVAKFGGSSVADIIQLRKIKEIIKGDPERRYIVVSAPGKRFEGDNKITDLLYLVKTTMDNMLPYEQLLQVVYDRYTAVHANLGLEVDMQQAYDEIKDKLRDNPSADYIASRGEYLNALLIADFLGFDFVLHCAAGHEVVDEESHTHSGQGCPENHQVAVVGKPLICRGVHGKFNYHRCRPDNCQGQAPQQFAEQPLFQWFLRSVETFQQFLRHLAGIFIQGFENNLSPFVGLVHLVAVYKRCN